MRKYLFAAFIIVVSTGCSKSASSDAPKEETTTAQTPAEICDAALAKRIIDQACTENKGSPYPGARFLEVKFGGDTAYAIVLEPVPSVDLMEKLQIDNKKALLSQSSLTDSDITFHADTKRKFLITVAALEHTAEAKPKVDRFIRFINPVR